MATTYKPVGPRDLVKIAREAAALVKVAHTISAIAEDDIGVPCGVTSDEAVRFNAAGALIRVTWRRMYDMTSLVEGGVLCPWADDGMLYYAVSRIVAPDDFREWQSAPGRTGSDVAAVLNRAADLIGRALAVAEPTSDGDGAIVRDLVDLIEGASDAA